MDELANPLQAAVVSAICFCTGAGLPLLAGAFIADPTARLVRGERGGGEGGGGLAPRVPRALPPHSVSPRPMGGAPPCPPPPPPQISMAVVTTFGLAFFGFLGAFLGGASVLRGGLRVLVGGWLALAIVYGIGRAFNVDTPAG